MEKSKYVTGTFNFVHNIPNTFISDIWGGTTLEAHFKAKFNGLCHRHGGYASATAIHYFMCELSDTHRKKFAEYIAKWIEDRG